ncbi:MAG TPA: DUF1844 domain-containing protein [Candidatus Acidoferrales bacterium]
MADPKHEDTSFKVIDRRLFSESGEIRPEVVEQERRDDEAAAKKAAAQAKAQASQPSAAPAQTPNFTGSPAAGMGGDTMGLPGSGFDGQQLAHGGADDLAGPEGPAGEVSASSRSFQMLIDFLTRNAAAMLGGMPDPRTGQAYVDLEGAREVIDMLDALREKTRGNLSKEDDNLLIEVLGSLKLTFMEISKAAAEQMAKKAKATK